VFGVRGDELVIASSLAAIEKIDAVMRGQEPNILADPRFAELGVGARDGIDSIGFSTVDASAVPFAHVLSTIGFFYSLMPDRKETRALAIAGNLMCKVGAALAEYDFRYDRAYEGWCDSGGAYEVRVVTRYR
jgi:hypothetical protein